MQICETFFWWMLKLYTFLCVVLQWNALKMKRHSIEVVNDLKLASNDLYTMASLKKIDIDSGAILQLANGSMSGHSS